ncbi:choline ABC transporter ATP-binding protein [soil metagenome]
MAAAGPAGEAMIVFERVSIVFGGAPERALALMERGESREAVARATAQVPGVHDCSLEVRKGEVSVLMGLSGSGKSTLLRAVNGLNPLARGRVVVRGRDGRMVDVGACDAATLRRLRRGDVAMVFQQFGLLPWRSVVENVALGLELAGMGRAARLAKAREVLATVNLADWAERRVAELSGGMQQRVGLARAFATDAEILLMDEPFSALDPLIRARLQDELLELQASMGCTILFVSHDLEEAVKIGNTITLMEGGRIVQTGTPEEIVLRPASPHVAAFVEAVNPLSVLRIADVMEPANLFDDGPALPPEAPLAAALPLFAAGAGVVLVEAGAGSEAIGRITPRAVFRALAGRSGGSAGGEAPPAKG